MTIWSTAKSKITQDLVTKATSSSDLGVRGRGGWELSRGLTDFSKCGLFFFPKEHIVYFIVKDLPAISYPFISVLTHTIGF